MRAFILKSRVSILVIIFLLVVCGVLLALFGPLHPGNIAFSIQYFVEQWAEKVYSSPLQKAAYLLDLLDKGITDLRVRAGTQFDLQTGSYMDKACAECIARCPRGLLKLEKSSLFIDLNQYAQKKPQQLEPQGMGNG